MVTPQTIIQACHYYPSLFHDYIHVLKSFMHFQIFSSKSRAPLHPIITTNCFFKWGIDFREHRHTSNVGHKNIIVEIYYFMKWTKAMPTFDNKERTITCFFSTTLSLTLVSLSNWSLTTIYILRMNSSKSWISI
jgi:hypothetical protein